ncbi:hypothetical protein RhiirA4_425810 [Rhizophagus irregularis]|uniref:Uncharacterized protein n=1 Tax=Rhizophagus irregularis TaxID=588596 RepID=A0A2I1H2N0_9GLOM|nr:hypothetical protein RhiirA4_425810 [Rhizophagus irregularis]
MAASTAIHLRSIQKWTFCLKYFLKWRIVGHMTELFDIEVKEGWDGVFIIFLISLFFLIDFFFRFIKLLDIKYDQTFEIKSCQTKNMTGLLKFKSQKSFFEIKASGKNNQNLDK